MRRLWDFQGPPPAPPALARGASLGAWAPLQTVGPAAVQGLSGAVTAVSAEPVPGHSAPFPDGFSPASLQLRASHPWRPRLLSLSLSDVISADLPHPPLSAPGPTSPQPAPGLLGGRHPPGLLHVSPAPGPLLEAVLLSPGGRFPSTGEAHPVQCPGSPHPAQGLHPHPHSATLGPHAPASRQLAQGTACCAGPFLDCKRWRPSLPHPGRT